MNSGICLSTRKKVAALYQRTASISKNGTILPVDQGRLLALMAISSTRISVILIVNFFRCLQMTLQSLTLSNVFYSRWSGNAWKMLAKPTGKAKTSDAMLALSAKTGLRKHTRTHKPAWKARQLRTWILPLQTESLMLMTLRVPGKFAIIHILLHAQITN